VGNKRGTPDFSAVANPATGVAAYDEDGNIFWFQVGGTSVSSPLLAGIVNSDGHHAGSTTDELTHVYRGIKGQYAQKWRDETTGNNGFPAMKGWDFVTGIGSPLTTVGK
jgi:kumamolisin